MCAIYRNCSADFCEAVDTSLVCVLGEAASYGAEYLNTAHDFVGHEQVLNGLRICAAQAEAFATKSAKNARKEAAERTRARLRGPDALCHAHRMLRPMKHSGLLFQSKPCGTLVVEPLEVDRVNCLAWSEVFSERDPNECGNITREAVAWFAEHPQLLKFGMTVKLQPVCPGALQRLIARTCENAPGLD
eukprot:1771391-Alexandrium_andersonii.AAC.1